MINEVYIIDDDESSTMVFRELFREDPEYKFISVKSEQIEIALKNIPSLIVINEDAIKMDVIDVCRKIRRDEDNTITPVIVVSSNGEREHRMKILNESIEYFIRKPVDEGYLYYTVKNLMRLLTINRRMSPLTGLPGNVQINSELKKHLLKNDEFSILYLDLDNFKAYNDVYGFLKGIIEKFPLTSISIAVVVVDKGRFANILEIGDTAAQVKHAVKAVMGSSYAIDRRRHRF